MTRDDVERITQNVLRELSIEIKNGGFTDPNSRTVLLKLGDTVLSETWFNVVQHDEYEG